MMISDSDKVHSNAKVTFCAIKITTAIKWYDVVNISLKELLLQYFENIKQNDTRSKVSRFGLINYRMNITSMLGRILSGLPGVSEWNSLRDSLVVEGKTNQNENNFLSVFDDLLRVVHYRTKYAFGVRRCGV